MRPICFGLVVELRSGSDKMHWSCLPVVNTVPDRCSDQAWADGPSKFGLRRIGVVWTMEQRWDSRETASALLTGRPSAAVKRFPNRLYDPRRSSLFAKYRRSYGVFLLIMADLASTADARFGC